MKLWEKIFWTISVICFMLIIAFAIAGFEAGRIKWHKVADGDLPESLMSVINQDGEKVVYNDYCKTWRYDDTNEYFCATPIAWCEIPKFGE